MILLNTWYDPFLEVRDGNIQDSLAEMWPQQTETHNSICKNRL